MNDLGNAMRLIRLVGGRFQDDGEVDHSQATLLYLRRRGWIAFNGKYWDLDAGEDLARRRAHQVAQGLIAQGPHAPVTGKPWFEFVTRSGSSGSSSAMLAQAASYLTVDLDAFDRQPLTINVRNGTLKFTMVDGKAKVAFAKRHDPADRVTRIAAVDYDPKAACPHFDSLLEFSQPVARVRDYLRDLFGYVFTGSTKEQLFVILQGKGGDGKSTLVNALKATGGTYALAAAVETFLDSGARRSSEASPDIARLAGDSRLICTAEPPGGAKLASAAIKSFTGGGTIVARELRQGLFEFQPIGKVVLECNRRPTINDTDRGIWRRLRIVQFKRQLRDEEIDRDLPAKLDLERAGILNWIVAGVVGWMEHGLVTPPEVLEAIEDYRKGANPFAEWVDECVSMEPEAVELASALYGHYKQWCEDQGHERPMTQTTFGRALGDLQVIRSGKDSAGRLRRKGARLRAKWETDGAPPPVDDAFGPSGPSTPNASAAQALPDVGEWEGS
ncbi:MAG TPA: phage/plasmid primase, P4 family [Bradyrhizobium sp.]|nr:phage/plasmid primase, P4 family [Bradyrhizobium sp.]